MVYDWGMVDSPDVRVVLDELTAVRQRFDRLAGDAYSLGQSLGNLERRLWGDPHEQAVLAELLHEIRRRFGSPGRMLDEREMRELSAFLFEYLAGVPRKDWDLASRLAKAQSRRRHGWSPRWWSKSSIAARESSGRGRCGRSARYQTINRRCFALPLRPWRRHSASWRGTSRPSIRCGTGSFPVRPQRPDLAAANVTHGWNVTGLSHVTEGGFFAKYGVREFDEVDGMLATISNKRGASLIVAGELLLTRPCRLSSAPPQPHSRTAHRLTCCRS